MLHKVMAIKGAKNTSMQDKPVAQKDAAEQEFFFPEYEITVKAKDIEDAQKKVAVLIKKK